MTNKRESMFEMIAEISLTMRKKKHEMNFCY